MFKLYLSGLTSDLASAYKELNPSADLNVLVSYAYRSNDLAKLIQLRKSGIINSLILDSGAFTLNQSKHTDRTKVNFEGFLTFCKYYKNDFDFIFNYDENFSETGFTDNYKNQKILEDEGIKVVPVVHDYLYETDEVETYLKEDYEIISLGFHEKNKNVTNIKKVADHIRSTGKKVHLLGLSEYKTLLKLTLDFADSSNWSKSLEFGLVYYLKKD